MKKFLIIGNGNAVTYKEVFPLIKDGKMWIGAGKGMGGKAMEFYVDESIYDSSKGSVNRIENGKCYVGVMMCTWFTNLDHKKRHEPLDLYKRYTPEEFPKYDNYDAIEVSKVCDIPKDYNGVMGVPITFLDKYCPEQFKILDARDYALNTKQKEKATQLIKDNDGTINDKTKYCRALNQRSNEMNARPVIDGKEIYRRVLNQNSKPLAPGEVSAYVDGNKKYARVFNEHSHPNPLAGGGQINGKITYKRIPIIRVKKDDN